MIFPRALMRPWEKLVRREAVWRRGGEMITPPVVLLAVVVVRVVVVEVMLEVECRGRCGSRIGGRVGT